MDNLLIWSKKLRTKMNFGHSSVNEIAIPQQQGNIGIKEKNVINLKLNKNNAIKLSKNGSKKVGASGNQEKMDIDI